MVKMIVCTHIHCKRVTNLSYRGVILENMQGLTIEEIAVLIFYDTS